MKNPVSKHQRERTVKGSPDSSIQAVPDLTQEMYNTLIDSLDEGILIVEFLTEDNNKVKDVHILEVNEAVNKHTGLKVSNLKGRLASEVLPSISDLWFRRFNEILSSKVPLRFEEYSHAVNRWLKIMAVPLNGDKVYGIHLNDITMKKTQHQLLTESATPTSVSNLNGVAHCRLIVDENGKPYDYEILKVNDNYTRIIGIAKEQIEGKKVREVFPGIENFSFNYIAEYGKVALEGTELNAEAYFETTQQHLSLYAYSIIKGEFTVVFTDITAAKQNEVSYKHQKDLLQTILNSIPVMITIYNPEATNIILNKELEKITGWTQDDFNTGNPMELVYPDPEYRGKIMEFMQNGKGWRDLVMTAKDGSKLETSWANIKLPDGRQVGIGIDIGERKKAEEANRILEERLTNTLDNLIEGCALLSYDYTYLYVNESHAAHAHRNSEEMIGKSIFEVIPGVENSVFFEVYKKCMDERTLEHVEAEFVFADGSSAWYGVTVQPVPEGIFIMSIDVTSRKKAENALKESEKLLQSTMDNFPTVIAFKDCEGRFMNVNKVVEDIFGMKKEKIIGLTDYDLFSKEMADTYRKHDLQVIETRKPMEREEITIVNGKKIYLLDISFPLVDSGGKVYGVGHISYDATEIKLAEEALKRNEMILRLILDHINEGIIVSEAPDGRVVAVSKWGINHTIGKDINAVIDLPIEDYLNQWDVRDIKTQEKIRPERLPIARALKGENIQGEEWLMMRPDGTDFTVSVNAVPIYNEDNTAITNTVATWTDISRKKRAEEERYESEQRYKALAVSLQEANVIIQNALLEKEFLMKEIHHRVKNNLQIIASLLHLQMETMENEDLKRTFVEGANRIRAIAMVHEKLYSDDLEIVKGTDYIPELVNLIRSTYKMDSQNITIDLNIASLQLNIDKAVPLGLLINEILSNSFKHAFRGMDSGKITITLQSLKDDEYELTVADNGIGLTSEDKKLGLGMALIENLILQLDGQHKIINSNGLKYIVTFKNSVS